jgi:putative ABC transport system permease protein
MRYRSTIKLALTSMIANKTRTLLTALGLVIGIAAVIIVFSTGDSINSLILGQVQAFGTDIIQSEARLPSNLKGSAKDTQSAQAMAQGVQLTSMKLGDMEAIDRLPNVKGSYADLTGQALVNYEDVSTKAILFGVSPYFIEVGTFKLSSGRFYTDEEDKGLAQVVVLGSKMKVKLFGDADAVGKLIRIKKGKYKVIGVMSERGSSGIISLDDFIYVPIRTMQKRLLGIDHVVGIISQLKDVSKGDETAEDIKALLRDRHKIEDPNKDDFSVMTMKEMLNTLGVITNALTLLLLAIVVISLIVGGVGITNIMYVVVTERTAEIGLRKAVGAKINDILAQFLIESVILTTLGGVIGSIVGVMISYAVSVVAQSYLKVDWQFVLPIKGFIVAGIFSIICGIVFGLFPARRAARLDPIEALRTE